MKINLTILTALIAHFAFGQTDNLEKGEFSLRYGVYFSGVAQQQIRISGMLDKHWELGAGFAFTYSTTNNSNSYTQTVTAISGPIDADEVSQSKSKSIACTLNPFVAYHFTFKSNLDIYPGIFAGVTAGETFDNKYIATSSAINYLVNVERTYITPPSFSVNGGAMFGCQYFFNRRFAIGAEASLGGHYTLQKGNAITKSVTENSGSNNPSNIYNNQSSSTTVNNAAFNLTTTGSVGVNVVVYFTRKVKMPDEQEKL
jgi:hypothetical protein